MSKPILIKKNFNGGEIDPVLHYRDDLDAYHKSCKSLKNMLVTPWGAAIRRPPTEFLSKIDTDTYGVPVKYVPFRFSIDETFHIVFTDGTGSAGISSDTASVIVFDADGNIQTLEGSSTKILDTVYDPDDLLSLHHIQVNDFIYMTCGGKYPIQKLNRFYSDSLSANRWKIEEFTLEVGPFLEENTDTSKLVSIGGLAEWDSAVTYSQGDEVRSAASKVGIDSASWVYWKSEQVPSPPGTGSRYEDYYRIKLITDNPHGINSGSTATISGVSGSDGNYDGNYGVVSGSGDDLLLNKVWVSDRYFSGQSPNSPPSLTVASGAEAYDANAAFGVFRSLIDNNLNNPLPVSGSDSNWLQLDNASQTSFTLNATGDIFPVGCEGQAFRLLKEYESQLRARWEADTISQNYAIQGNITLTTEGGAWDGVLKLQESKDGGGNWETIGRIISVDGQFNGSIEREIFEPSSLIRVKLEDFNTPSGVYDEEACIWKLETTGNSYEYFRITSRVSGSEVTADPITPIEKMRSGSRWAFGAFSQWTGYPNTLTIHDERMVFGGNKSKPNTVWASRVNDWNNFLEGDTEVSPYTFTIKSDSFDAVKWMRSTRNLMVGTENSETTMGSRDDNSVISPTNIDVRTHTYFGSKNIQAVVTADLIFFVQGQGKRVRSTQYDFGTDQFLSTEMSLFASHITDPGIKEMSYRRHPWSTIFFVLNDGTAVNFTYERDNMVNGWTRVQTDGEIVSAASNYSAKGDIIAGIVKRNGEYFLEEFGTADETTIYLDAQLYLGSDALTGGASVPYADAANIEVIKDDGVLPLSSYTLSSGTLTIPSLSAGEEVTVGLPFVSEIIPTDVSEFGPHGSTKRATNMSLYLQNSGNCDIKINGRDTIFTDGERLEAGERLNGDYEISTKSGYDGAIEAKMIITDHKPFNILGIGYKIT